MNRASLPKTVRRVIFALHLWGGLSVGLFLTLMGLTGALLMFLEPVSHLSDPMRVAPLIANTRPASLDAAWANVHARYPTEKLQRVYFPNAPDQSLTFLTAQGVWGPGGMVKEFGIHPGTGEMLALPRPRYGVFYNTVFYLHMDLLAVTWRETAKMLSGWGALLSLVLIGSGLYLWWPTRREQWRTRLAPPLRRGKRLAYDLHNLAGFAGWGLLTLQALTGLSYQWKEPVQNAVYTLTGTPKSATKKPKVAKDAAFLAPLDLVRARAEAVPPALPITQIQVPLKPGEPIRVSKTFPAGSPRGGESVFVYLHPTTGKLLRRDDNLPRNRADAVLRWMSPLHFGTWAIRYGTGAENSVRILYALTGLLPLFLLVTGLLQYLRLRQAKHANRVRRVADTSASLTPPATTVTP